MPSPITEWLNNSWDHEEYIIEKLPCITDKPKLSIGKSGSTLFVNVKVAMPTKGPVCAIQEVEQICIVLPPNFPHTRPIILVRHDFPPVPHLGSRKERYRDVCLTVQGLTPDLAEQFGYKGEKGVVVAQVTPGSVAAQAGIQPGALIQEVNRKQIDSVDEFKQAIKKSENGTSVLLLIRDGKYSRYVVLNIEE